jgi:SAM-dependent methyltransferase
MIRVALRSSRRDYDWEHLYQSFLAVVRSDDVVLEIGASNPHRTQALARHCRELIGVELFPERVLPSQGNIRYVQGDWQNLSSIVPAASINLAISSHVIEHVPDDLAALRETYAVLRPGGRAIFNTPNRKRFTRALIEALQGERRFPWWEHVREYVERDLVALIGKTHFTAFRIQPVVFGLHGGPLYAYSPSVPPSVRRWANFWEVQLTK